MESIIKKLKQRFKKAREEMARWDVLQSRMVSQYRNACAIIGRLPLLQDSKNFGVLNAVPGIQEKVLMKQKESLQNIFNSMRETLDEFHGITLALEKIHRGAKDLTNQLTPKQLQLRIGVGPTFAYYLEGLSTLHEIHCSEYSLKVKLYDALTVLTLEFNAKDLSAVQQLLVDQPNIIKEDVHTIFRTVLWEEM